MKRWIKDLADHRMLFRRIVLLWAMTVITYVIYIVADHNLLIQIGAAGATIVTGIIGILTTVISFYQWHRTQDDKTKKTGETDATTD